MSDSTIDHDVAEMPRAEQSSQQPEPDKTPPRDDGAATGDDAEGVARRRRRRPWVFTIGLIVLALLAAGGYYYYLSTWNVESTDDAYTDGRVVSIAPQVSGVVVSLDVTDNQFVRRGDPLIHIDPRQYENDRELAEGALATAKAQHQGQQFGAEIARKNFPALLDQAEAQLASANAALSKAQADYNRQTGLSKQATSQQDVDAARAALKQAEAQVALANAQVVVASPVPQHIGETDLDASWQLDLWGSVRREVESAGAQVDRAAEHRRDALVSSLAELASDYIQLRGVQTQVRIANDNLKIDRDILELAQERQKKGVQNALDVESAAAQVESVRAQIPQFEQQEVQYINALSLLLGREPGALKAELGRARAVPPAPARVPVGVPSELARRRPDIRAAEAQLHAATADIGVAVGAFYPSVQLNGTVGYDSLHLYNLFSPGSLEYTVGPTISVPIFAGGRLKSTLELRKAQQVEAAIAYR